MHVPSLLPNFELSISFLDLITVVSQCWLIFVKAQVTVPFLRCFKADWVMETYLRCSLRNQKGYTKRKLAKRMAMGIDTSDNGLDGDDCRSLEGGKVGSLGGSDC